ncbi:hypothetical protein BGY98DRAFT_940548 [Russula aff. rugulosa BPL654]|nr:hypothetical protein BGY98DRAFT_940548 [Russula aff. rugulosa BPL654]
MNLAQDGQQQDAEEFLSLYLDTLDEELPALLPSISGSQSVHVSFLIIVICTDVSAVTYLRILSTAHSYTPFTSHNRSPEEDRKVDPVGPRTRNTLETATQGKYGYVNDEAVTWLRHEDCWAWY